MCRLVLCSAPRPPLEFRHPSQVLHLALHIWRARPAAGSSLSRRPPAQPVKAIDCGAAAACGLGLEKKSCACLLTHRCAFSPVASRYLCDIFCSRVLAHSPSASSLPAVLCRVLPCVSHPSYKCSPIPLAVAQCLLPCGVVKRISHRLPNRPPCSQQISFGAIQFHSQPLTPPVCPQKCSRAQNERKKAAWRSHVFTNPACPLASAVLPRSAQFFLSQFAKLSHSPSGYYLNHSSFLGANANGNLNV